MKKFSKRTGEVTVYSQGSEHPALGLTVLGLWKNTLHFLVPSLWLPFSLGVSALHNMPTVLVSSTAVAPDAAPQVLSTKILLSCPQEPAPVSLPQDNTSCPGGPE